MDPQPMRRQKQTYGKTRKPLIFDFYDDSTADSASDVQRDRSERSPTPSFILRQSLVESIGKRPILPQPTERNKASPTPVTGADERYTNPKDVYELHSSDEERQSTITPARQLKRRKISDETASSPEPRDNQTPKMINDPVVAPRKDAPRRTTPVKSKITTEVKGATGSLLGEKKKASASRKKHELDHANKASAVHNQLQADNEVYITTSGHTSASSSIAERTPKAQKKVPKQRTSALRLMGLQPSKAQRKSHKQTESTSNMTTGSDIKDVTSPSHLAFRSLNLAPKARLTYGKQRSHLSETMAGASINTNSSSQGSSTNSMPVLGLTSSSQLDFDLDDDSDGSNPSIGLKSIHELRKAGTDNRLDRDFDSILEDMDDPDQNVKVRALLRLCEKIQDGSLSQHIIDTNKISRLTALINDEMTPLDGFILLICLRLLKSTLQQAMKQLDQICGGLIKLVPILSKEQLSISKLSNEVRPVLSRSLVVELRAFEDRLRESDSIVYTSSRDAACDLLIDTLADCVRQLLDRHETLPIFPSSTIGFLLDYMEQNHSLMPESSCKTETAEHLTQILSLLEAVCTQFRNNNVPLTKDIYERVGISHARLLVRCRDQWTTTQQGVLRVIISLSNDNEDACECLSATPIIAEILAIIDHRFLHLADDAEKGHALDKASLDSVILALGCLLNFADCDAVSRRRISRMKKVGKSQIDSIIDIFNKKIDLTGEALTLDQSQILVAFGYLSMFLCTLCLDGTVRSHINDSIKGHDLNILLTAAETFLIHIKTIESESDMDPQTTSFTERFAAILDEVKRN